MLTNIRDFPEEIIEPIKALTDATRRRILLSLLETDSIPYSRIQGSFKAKKGTLNHHLHVLVSSGLIRNFSIESPGNPYSSYYAITSFGRKFVEGLRQTLEPKIIRRTITATSATITDEIIADSASESEEKEQIGAGALETARALTPTGGAHQ